MTTVIIFVLIAAVLIGLAFLIREILKLRRIVPPSEIHVVRQGDNTFLYGAVSNRIGSGNIINGNTYYDWPSWLPVIGVNVKIMPLAVFDIKLDDYRCNDNGKLPLSVDVQAFFRISDYQLAAASIRSSEDLKKQLRGVLEGTARHLFGKNDIETIMISYSGYGKGFTELIDNELSGWGIRTAKSIEIMDVHDAPGETVIKNIMQRKKSEVEKASRMAVAKNNEEAKKAEIDAMKAIELAEQEKLEIIGRRTAEATAAVNVEKEKAAQKTHDAAKVTKEKLMAVSEVEATRKAEIEKRAKTIAAEAERDKMSIESAGELAAKKNEAMGIKVKGQAEADAEKSYQMASVEAQTALAKEIGSNDGYQRYLVQTHQINAAKSVGLKQAENLGNADIRIIAGAGDISTGVGKAAGVFSPNGGFGMAGMLEAMGATDEGKALLESVNSFLNRSSKGAAPSTLADMFEKLNATDEGKKLLESVSSYLSNFSKGDAVTPPAGN